jgi:hypothetical protein
LGLQQGSNGLCQRVKPFKELADYVPMLEFQQNDGDTFLRETNESLNKVEQVSEVNESSTTYPPIGWLLNEFKSFTAYKPILINVNRLMTFTVTQVLSKMIEYNSGNVGDSASGLIPLSSSSSLTSRLYSVVC